MRLALAMLVIVLASQPVCAQIIPICGDANNDGDIAVGDAVSALRVAAQLPGTCPLAVCDVNADDRLSVTDAVNILRNAAALPAVVNCKDVTGGN
jgi:hypothetical protein